MEIETYLYAIGKAHDDIRHLPGICDRVMSGVEYHKIHSPKMRIYVCCTVSAQTDFDQIKEVAQYDVAEAIAAGLSKDDVIVLRGVVTNMAAKGSNFATYGSLKIYVKDATGAAGEFQLFNCMSLENAKFTTTTPAYDAASTQWADFTSVTDANGNKLSVGDTVFAFGKYELYNSTYELQQGCYLLEIKEGQAPQPEVIEMTYTTTDGLQWTDATADQGEQPPGAEIPRTERAAHGEAARAGPPHERGDGREDEGDHGGD